MSILSNRKSPGNLTDCLEGVVKMKNKLHKLGSELKHRIKMNAVGIAIFAVFFGAMCGRFVAAQAARNTGILPESPNDILIAWTQKYENPIKIPIPTLCMIPPLRSERKENDTPIKIIIMITKGKAILPCR